jgi:Xaa-Pro aminopeptidase
MSSPSTNATAFAARRRALAERLPGPALLAAGLPLSRNYRANTYPFRARSHFLYFVGASLPGAALLLARDAATLFVVPEAEGDALWHGPQPSMEELRAQHGLTAVRPLDDLDAALRDLSAPVATLPTDDARSAAWLSERLGRPIHASSGDKLAEGSPDVALAEAMIALRLTHDEAAVAQLRAAAEVSARAHIAGMRATRPGGTEAEVAGAMIGALRREGLESAYNPIVTVHGEVLHNEHHHGALAAGDLLLADVGGETREGWAADITRVWPVSGRFSATQRAIYDVVLASQRAAIDHVRKGVRYRAVHDTAKRVMVEGLRDLGIFQGDVDGLLERGAAAIFFPHGIGHLLGLDVHDMEDLGDRAGYAPGRARSSRFGDGYLRLDRDLAPGMAVTIEPGFYQVPAILRDERYVGPVGDDLRRDVLARYADVRGIRIEDDVLCTEGEPEVLTRSVPKDASEVEAVMSSERGRGAA